jgi:transcriptional regulator with XRE-family HTH domain
MKPNSQTKAKAKLRDISVVNLPDELTIQDPKEFIQRMRSTFLAKAREMRGISLSDVAKRCDTTTEEIKRIESGKVNENDMMLLSELAEVYEIDYPNLLYMFRLAKPQATENTLKMAAYHDQQADEETQKKLLEFIESIRDCIE